MQSLQSWRPLPPRNPLTFVHIPKTAGTSLRYYLENQYGPATTCIAENWIELFPLRETIKDYRLLRGHFGANIRGIAIPDAKSVVLLRDPIRRTLSALIHLARDPNFNPQAYELAKGLTLKEMLRNERLMLLFANAHAAALCAATSPADIFAYIEKCKARDASIDIGSLEDEPKLAFAQQRLESFDFVGVVEQLDLFMSELSDGMQFHPAAKFSRINAAPSAHSLEQLDREDIDILSFYNDIDIPLYDFARRLTMQRRLAKSIQSLINSNRYSVPHGSFVIPLAGSVPGSGWYYPESEGGISWRWTGPDPEFTLELGLDPTADYEVQIRFSSPDREITGSDVEVFVNANRVPVFVHKPGAYFIKFDITSSLLARFSGACCILCNIGNVYEKSGDERKLGILVNEIAFREIG